MSVCTPYSLTYLFRWQFMCWNLFIGIPVMNWINFVHYYILQIKIMRRRCSGSLESGGIPNIAFHKSCIPSHKWSDIKHEHTTTLSGSSFIWGVWIVCVWWRFMVSYFRMSLNRFCREWVKWAEMLMSQLVRL